MHSKINKKSNGLALAIGHIFGDGGIQDNGRVHYCNSEKFLIDEFMNSMKVFNIRPWIKKESNIIRVRYPVKIGKILWNLFEKFSSGKDTKIITSQIREMPKKWKAKMLQAWFNDDGSVVNMPPNYKVIAIKQKLKPLTLFIRDILNESQIKSQVIEDNGTWLLRVHGYENIIRFREHINFSKGYRKRQKLDEMINSINRPHLVAKKKILRLLEESPKIIKEISQLLDLNRNVVYCHLHGWKRKNRKSNKGLIDLGLVRMKKRGRINLYEYSVSPTPGFGWEGTGSSTDAQC